MTDMVTGLISAINTLITGLFSTSTDGAGGAAVGIGVLTGAVLAVALLRKATGRAKKAIG